MINAIDNIHGVLLVDKPRGPTSHDVVALARRALRNRSIGHAGTLDPMATGLLVLAVGEGTKLLNYLSGDTKQYVASIRLGSETDSLDADGNEIKTGPLLDIVSLESVQETANVFIGPIMQIPPALSAIKVGGERLYAKARRGESVDIPERAVVVHELSIVNVCASQIDFSVTCSKGFYVRSLARDLARALGTVGHLSALRRTRSGQFRLDGAVSSEWVQRAITDSVARDSLISQIVSLSDACSGLTKLMLTPEGCRDAFHGRPISPSRVCGGQFPNRPTGPIALVDANQQLLAIASFTGSILKIDRGLRYGGLDEYGFS
jgi:tRNA pseudouridine55 synthase